MANCEQLRQEWKEADDSLLNALARKEQLRIQAEILQTDIEDNERQVSGAAVRADAAYTAFVNCTTGR